MARDNIQFISADLVFGDDGTPVSMGSLPPNSQIIDIQVPVTTAFDSSGTDLVIVGISSDDNRYATAIDVSSAGAASVTQLIFGVEDVNASTEVFAEYNQSVTDAAAGACTVIMSYIQK